MARPKKGTKGGEAASLKWRETMQQRYGGAAGVHKMMSINGAKGGRTLGVKKGFAANPALARLSGKKGGQISKRKGTGVTWEKISSMRHEIIGLINEENKSIAEISRITGISKSALYKYVKEELRGIYV